MINIIHIQYIQLISYQITIYLDRYISMVLHF